MKVCSIWLMIELGYLRWTPVHLEPRLPCQNCMVRCCIRNLPSCHHSRVCASRHLLLQAMMATAMADDHVAKEEDATLQDVYAEVMRCSLDEAEVSQASEEMRSAGIQVRESPGA